MFKRRYKRLVGRIEQRRREYIFSHQPICAIADCYCPAQEVDHIKPSFMGGPDTLENLQGLCKAHHAKKTSRERRIWTARPRKKAIQISNEWKNFINNLAHAKEVKNASK